MHSDTSKPLVSFVVPVYNVAPYVGKCLVSIAGQTVRDIEIIVVDDGSTDGTGNVCDEFAAEDGRIRIFHTKNCGVSHARNIGIDEATGEFVCFVDADDWVAPEFAERMIALVLNSGANAAACGATRIGLNGNIVWKSAPQKMVLCGEAALCGALRRDLYCGWPWNKMFRRKLLDDKGVRFDESLRYCEDLLFCFDAICAAESIAYDSTETIYFYRDSPASVNRKVVADGRFDAEYLGRFEADAKIIERTSMMSARVRRYARANAFVSGENVFRKAVATGGLGPDVARKIATHMCKNVGAALACPGFGGLRTRFGYIASTAHVLSGSFPSRKKIAP